METMKHAILISIYGSLGRNFCGQSGEHKVLSSSHRQFRSYLVSAGSATILLGWYDLFFCHNYPV
uniref:Uncharacterized protein n=1 Tax=Arundo donax TaxID=35708 RepID=A0A0A9FLH8_ARUDO